MATVQSARVTNYCHNPIQVQYKWEGGESTQYHLWMGMTRYTLLSEFSIPEDKRLQIVIQSEGGATEERTVWYSANGQQAIVDVHDRGGQLEVVISYRHQAMLGGAASDSFVSNPLSVTDLGRGYNTLTGQTKIPLMNVSATASTGGPNSFDSFVEYDYREIREKTDVNVQVNVETLSTSVDFSLDYSNELHSEQMSVYVFHRLKVTTGIESIKTATISERAAALKTKTAQEIYEQAGNSVITKITKGGEMCIIARFTSTSVEQSQSIKAALSADTEILGSDVKFKSALKHIHESISKHVTCSISAKWIGGSAKAELLQDPATAIKAIEDWQKTLATLPAVISVHTEDLNYVAAEFRNVSVLAQRYQGDATALRKMQGKILDTLTQTKQYHSARQKLGLRKTAAAIQTQNDAEALRAELVQERERLATNAMGSFTLTATLADRVKTCRQKTPLFSYTNIGRDEWGGYGHSGMEPFGLQESQLKDIKQLTFVRVIADRTINGMMCKYTDFANQEHTYHCAQQIGNKADIPLQNDLLTQVHYWGHARGDWMAVGGLAFITASGTKYGPYSHHLPNPENAWGIATPVEGNERYLIGFWGSGNSTHWMQKIGPYYRQCSTKYPYAD